MQSGTLLDGKVPVFVFPNSINFYLEDKTTHKQVLTLYNPYDFVIHFRVLCTAPKKYTVVDSDGSIKPQCCIDIVVRHNVISPGNCNVTDKFRIQMRDYTTKQVIGRRDVTATLLSGEPDHDRMTPDHDSFQSMPNVSSSKPPLPQYNMINRTAVANQGRTNNPSCIVIAVGIVCVIALLLPTEGDSSSSSSPLAMGMQVSVNIKLMVSYILGLISMVVLRPN